MRKLFLLIFISVCMTPTVVLGEVYKVKSPESPPTEIWDNKEAALEYVKSKILDGNLSYGERCYWARIHIIILERQGLAPIYLIEKEKKKDKKNKKN